MLTRSDAQRRHRVLVMDHDEGSREELQNHLSKAGFQVTLAGDHAELCLKLLTWHPDVVLASADARPRETLALAQLIRRSARRPVPAVLICDEAPQTEIGAGVVLRALLFAEVLVALHSALVGADEEPERRRSLPRARGA